MKTQLSKPSRSKASYTDEYKREALELWSASGRAPPRWRRSWVSAHRCSIVGRGRSERPRRPKIVRKPACSLEQLEAEIHRLRAENAKLLEQREVIKISLGILSEAPLRGMPGSNR